MENSKYAVRVEGRFYLSHTIDRVESSMELKRARRMTKKEAEDLCSELHKAFKLTSYKFET